jgi:rod shape-determining protein MreB
LLLFPWGGIVAVKSIRVGGDEMDDAIIQHIKRNYKLAIGERTAEEIKVEIGSAYLEDEASRGKMFEVRGRDLVSGLPKTIMITAGETNSALAEPIASIIEAIKVCLEKAPPELASDIMDRGIMMAGGSSLLHGLDRLVSRETGMPVHLAEEPLWAVVIGSGKVLENIDVLKRVLISPKKGSKRT